MADDIRRNNQLVKAKTSSLQKRDSNIVRRGLADLGLLDVDSNVLKYVNKIKYSKDWDERQSAWLELRKMGPTYKGWVTSLVDLIYNSDGWGRIFAAESLSQFKEAANDVVPVLDSLLEVSLNQDDTEWARIAAGSLGKYDANSSESTAYVIPTLIKALECNDYNVRGYAAKALDNWGQLSKSTRVKQVIDLFMKGSNYFKNKEYDKAIGAYTFVIILGMEFDKAYMGRGSAYCSKGQYERAIEDFNKAIAINQNLDLSQAYYNRGFAYELLGNRSMAISDYRKACDLGLEIGCENLQRVLRQK